ncbi:bluetail domain-containing putative surface protein, partial [Synechococcus sp.]
MAERIVTASQFPTFGNNPWVEGVSYNGKLINKGSTEKGSLGGGPAVNVEIYFANKAELAEDYFKELSKASDVATIFPWPENMVTGYLDGFKTWSDVANIKFSQSALPAQADIQYYTSTFTDNTLGSHQGINTPYPDGPKTGFPQVSFITSNYINKPTSKGSDFLETAIHEIGHGIGLKHPHDDGLGNPMPIFPGLVDGDAFARTGYGLHALNQNVYTIMSYNRGALTDPQNNYLLPPTDTVGHSATPMALDIMAAQLKYGYNPTTAAGNDIYLLPAAKPGEATHWETIYDTNGIDTLNAESASSNVVINLKAAPLNAYRFQEKEYSESYNFDDSPYGNIYKKLIELQAPHGGLLGSALLLATTINDVVIRIENNELLKKKYFNGLSFDEFVQNNPILQTILKVIGYARSELSENDSKFSANISQISLLANSILAESAANAGGYISQQLKTQGGFTIAAGTTIENAIGSAFGDTIYGNYFGNAISAGGGKDHIDGYLGDDTITGGADGDILIGGLGNNIFKFPVLSDSLITDYDWISDLKIGFDQITAPTAIKAQEIIKLGTITSIKPFDISNTLNAGNYLPNKAAIFSYQNGDKLNTFLTINDSVAGFQPAKDAVIEITGYQGNLNSLSIALDSSSTTPIRSTPLNTFLHFADPITGQQMYSADPVEQANLINNNFYNQGIGFQLYGSSTGNSSLKDVYRLYNPVNRDHLFTINTAEVSYATSVGYHVEGIIGAAIPFVQGA